MKVTISPSSAKGSVLAPPSKSEAHRALICAALSEKSTVKNIARSEDISATLGCLKAMGAEITEENNAITLGGLRPEIIKPCVLNCRESGSTLRFLIPLCMLSESEITLSGTERLISRDLSVYEEIAKEQGLLFKKEKTSVTVKGKLKPGKYTVRGDISSQFITGLMLALTSLSEDSEISVTEPFESKPYVFLTKKIAEDFGADVSVEKNIFKTRGKIRYRSREYTVNGDMSNAAFLDAFNFIGGNVRVLGTEEKSIQGDSIYREMFKRLASGEKDFDLSDCPDLAPVMFALSAYFGGARFTGTKRLKIKESDRAEAMKEELSKLGASVRIYNNGVITECGELKAPKEAICGHNDHRIVMALSVLLSLTGGEICGAEAVNKSYPNFFEDIKALGIEVKFER